LISNITAKEISKITNNIIDVRSIEKFNDSHIPFAKNIPKDELLRN